MDQSVFTCGCFYNVGICNTRAVLQLCGEGLLFNIMADLHLKITDLTFAAFDAYVHINVLNFNNVFYFQRFYDLT